MKEVVGMGVRLDGVSAGVACGAMEWVDWVRVGWRGKRGLVRCFLAAFG